MYLEGSIIKLSAHDIFKWYI